MRAYREKGNLAKGKGKGEDTNVEVAKSNQVDTSSAKKNIKNKTPPAKKKKIQPFSGSEHARLFHTIFHDTDNAKATLDLLLTHNSHRNMV